MKKQQKASSPISKTTPATAPSSSQAVIKINSNSPQSLTGPQMPQIIKASIPTLIGSPAEIQKIHEKIEAQVKQLTELSDDIKNTALYLEEIQKSLGTLNAAPPNEQATHFLFFNALRKSLLKTENWKPINNLMIFLNEGKYQSCEAIYNQLMVETFIHMMSYGKYLLSNQEEDSTFAMQTFGTCFRYFDYSEIDLLDESKSEKFIISYTAISMSLQIFIVPWFIKIKKSKQEIYDLMEKINDDSKSLKDFQDIKSKHDEFIKNLFPIKSLLILSTTQVKSANDIDGLIQEYLNHLIEIASESKIEKLKETATHLLIKVFEHTSRYASQKGKVLPAFVEQIQAWTKVTKFDNNNYSIKLQNGKSLAVPSPSDKEAGKAVNQTSSVEKEDLIPISNPATPAQKKKKRQNAAQNKVSSASSNSAPEDSKQMQSLPGVADTLQPKASLPPESSSSALISSETAAQPTLKIIDIPMVKLEDSRNADIVKRFETFARKFVSSIAKQPQILHKETVLRNFPSTLKSTLENLEEWRPFKKILEEPKKAIHLCFFKILRQILFDQKNFIAMTAFISFLEDPQYIYCKPIQNQLILDSMTLLIEKSSSIYPAFPLEFFRMYSRYFNDSEIIIIAPQDDMKLKEIYAFFYSQIIPKWIEAIQTCVEHIQTYLSDAERTSKSPSDTWECLKKDNNRFIESLFLLKSLLLKDGKQEHPEDRLNGIIEKHLEALKKKALSSNSTTEKSLASSLLIEIFENVSISTTYKDEAMIAFISTIQDTTGVILSKKNEYQLRGTGRNKPIVIRRDPFFNPPLPHDERAPKNHLEAITKQNNAKNPPHKQRTQPKEISLAQNPSSRTKKDAAAKSSSDPVSPAKPLDTLSTEQSIGALPKSETSAIQKHIPDAPISALDKTNDYTNPLEAGSSAELSASQQASQSLSPDLQNSSLSRSPVEIPGKSAASDNSAPSAEIGAPPTSSSANFSSPSAQDLQIFFQNYKTLLADNIRLKQTVAQLAHSNAQAHTHIQKFMESRKIEQPAQIPVQDRQFDNTVVQPQAAQETRQIMQAYAQIGALQQAIDQLRQEHFQQRLDLRSSYESEIQQHLKEVTSITHSHAQELQSLERQHQAALNEQASRYQREFDQAKQKLEVLARALFEQNQEFRQSSWIDGYKKGRIEGYETGFSEGSKSSRANAAPTGRQRSTSEPLMLFSSKLSFQQEQSTSPVTRKQPECNNL